MFKYFPTNYVWNLSVNLAIEMGVRLGEIEEMCTLQQEVAMQPDAAGTTAFRETWARMADKQCALAEEDEARGRLISVGDKYGRAATYYLTAERLQAHGAADRLERYRRFLDVFAGNGDALRLHGMHAVYNGELWRNAWRARAVSRCRTTGSTRAGSEAPRTRTNSCASPRTSTSMASSTASRCRSCSPTAPGIRRSRCTGPSALTSNWSTALSVN
ncbi:hypothetical protein BCO37747_07387 [Burkholderia contaminans]|uniref:Uncharacterized protein n=1 Tax=Burkholderia contaminans TaxID=488447 RepID=A0A250LH82_9BURK|nr:hypothetical protein SK875_C01035 [Burkholderia contaminans]BBA43867.1 hypothetical protein BCCH1_63690 [Burkholderia contaminans]GLZ74628.1 hypothetical protein Bcon01_76730 [Burkholderia contaminans]VWB05531.1 hypothetical protein BCO23253_00055 [Burkholderia contaminans]VWD61495.1 hypothetical protein BCO37747_07387 [Burkholderia contaminans]